MNQQSSLRSTRRALTAGILICSVLTAVIGLKSGRGQSPTLTRAQQASEDAAVSQQLGDDFSDFFSEVEVTDNSAADFKPSGLPATIPDLPLPRHAPNVASSTQPGASSSIPHHSPHDNHAALPEVAGVPEIVALPEIAALAESSFAPPSQTEFEELSSDEPDQNDPAGGLESASILPEAATCPEREFSVQVREMTPQLVDANRVAIDAESSTVAITESPVFSEVPVSEVPVSEVPVSEVPVSEVPVSEVPVSEVPVSEVPVSEVPVSEVPVSEVPVSEVPVSEVPVSEVPVSEVPVPETVLVPETVAPVETWAPELPVEETMLPNQQSAVDTISIEPLGLPASSVPVKPTNETARADNHLVPQKDQPSQQFVATEASLPKPGHTSSPGGVPEVPPPPIREVRPQSDLPVRSTSITETVSRESLPNEVVRENPAASGQWHAVATPRVPPIPVADSRPASDAYDTVKAPTFGQSEPMLAPPVLRSDFSKMTPPVYPGVGAFAQPTKRPVFSNGVMNGINHRLSVFFSQPLPSGFDSPDWVGDAAAWRDRAARTGSQDTAPEGTQAARRVQPLPRPREQVVSDRQVRQAQIAATGKPSLAAAKPVRSPVNRQSVQPAPGSRDQVVSDRQVRQADVAVTGKPGLAAAKPGQSPVNRQNVQPAPSSRDQVVSDRQRQQAQAAATGKPSLAAAKPGQGSVNHRNTQPRSEGQSNRADQLPEFMLPELRFSEFKSPDWETSFRASDLSETFRNSQVVHRVTSAVRFASRPRTID